jgi:hypothetical protein
MFRRLVPEFRSFMPRMHRYTAQQPLRLRRFAIAGCE